MRLLLIFLLGPLLAAATPPLPPTVVAGAAPVSVHYSATDKFEGPVWDPASGHLYFTAFGPNRADTRILCLDTEGRIALWMDRTEGINGMTLGRDGRLLCAQSFGHRVLSFRIGREAPEDPLFLLVNPSLNQPNDLREAANGHIYFTDPDFPTHQRGALYLLKRNGEHTCVARNLSTPNGLALSKDGTLLIVSDSETRRWLAFPILPDGALGEARVFFDPPMADKQEPGTKPDGLCLDEAGNFYLTGHHGIWVLDPKATVLGFIPVPEFPSNVCFGGPDGRTLFVTAHHNVYRLPMGVRGLFP